MRSIIPRSKFPFSSFVLPSMLFISAPIIAQQQPITEADVQTATQKLAEKGYLSQGEFLNTVKEAGPASIPTLKQNLRHQNPDVKKASLTALWTIRVPCEEAVNEVSSLLTEADKGVRYNAVYYLTDQRCETARNSIIELMNRETDPEVYRIAVDSLGNLGNASDFIMLEGVQNAPDQPVMTRISAARSLLMQGQPGDLTFLKDNLSNPDLNVMFRVLSALDYASDQSVIESIRPLLSRPRLVQAVAADTIRSIELNRTELSDQERKDRLFTALQGSDEEQRWAVNQLLRRYPTETVPRLKEIALDKNNPASLAVMEELDLKGFLTREEMKEQMKQFYPAGK